MHKKIIKKTKRNQCNDITETNTCNTVMAEVGYDKFLYDKIVNPDSMDKHEALPCITRKILIKKNVPQFKGEKNKTKKGGGGGAYRSISVNAREANYSR